MIFRLEDIQKTHDTLQHIALMNKKLKFHEKSHTYKYGKQKLTSVTTAISEHFGKFDATGISKYVAKSRQAKGEDITAKQVREEWKATAEFGTKIHAEIEDCIVRKRTHTECIRDCDPVTLNAYTWFRNERMFIDTVVIPELRICHPLKGLAGTIDGFAFSVPEQTFKIFDWKTNKIMRPDALKKYKVQIYLYALMMEQAYGLKSAPNHTIVHIPNELEVIPYIISMDDQEARDTALEILSKR